jgi:integral membrane sensor domain MASE1
MGIASGVIKNMKLLGVYIVFVAIGQAMSYGIGRTVEFWSPATSLPVFLACFFFVLWAAWRLAVRVP